MTTILELFNTREVLGYLQDAPRNTYMGEYLFPERKQSSLDFTVLLAADQTPVIAEVHAFDTESVIRSRTATVNDMRLLLVKNKIPLKEEEIIKLENPRNSEELDYLRRNVYNDMDRMVDNVRARAEKMRMDVLANGVLQVQENGVTLSLDYGVPADHKETLTTTAWDQAGSDPIADIQRWSEALNGKARRAVTSTKIMNTILRNANVIGAVIGLQGRVPTRNELNIFLSAQGLPTLVTYDDQYDVENADGSKTRKRYFPEDKFVMFGDGILGETIYGPTAEETRLRRDPSIETNLYGTVLGMVYESNVDPVSTWTKAVATVAPSFPKATEVFQAKVITTP